MQANALLSQRQAAKDAAAVTQAKLLRLANQIPDNPELPSLIIELQDTANEAGVEFMRMQPGNPVAKAGYSAIQMDLNLTGRWADNVEFMRRLRDLDRQVRVVNVSIIAPTDEGELATGTGSPVLGSAVKLEAYVQGTAIAEAAGSQGSQ